MKYFLNFYWNKVNVKRQLKEVCTIILLKKPTNALVLEM